MRVVAIRSCAGRWPRSLVTGLFSAEVAVGCSGRLLTAGSARSVADWWTGYRSSGSPAGCHRVSATPGGGSSSWRRRGAGACRRPGRRPRHVSGSPGPGGGRRGLPPRPTVALIWSHHGRAVATAEPLVTISGPRTVHMRGLWPFCGLCGRFVVCLWPLAGQLETTPMEIRCLVVFSWPFCGLKETIAETLALSWSLDGLPVSVAGPVADTWWSPPGPVVAVRRPRCSQ